MKKTKRTRIAIALCAALMAVPAAGCSRIGQSADPSTWGYDCKVYYDALGGVVNAREVRTTYYLKNSYVFEPSGSSNMLVEPVRDGYVLAGWYTAKTDTPAADGEEYTFRAEDRWDFNLDRVQGDMTLYARWLPRGKVNYIDADTGETIFSKNITSDSPVQELSDAVVDFSKPDGTTLFGYYADRACTETYDFASYVHSDPNPTEATLYETLCDMYPQYLERAEYVETDEEDAEETIDTSYLFLNKLGYQLKTTDEAALTELRQAKDQLIEQSIQNYLTNTADKVVYMKFVDGNYVLVSTPGDIKSGGEYGFFGEDALGSHIDGYVIEEDLDFAGITITPAEEFSGTIYGNGHTIYNLSLSVSSKKVDTDKEKFLALVLSLHDTAISDLTFRDAAISILANKGIPVKSALIAVKAENVTLTNCHIYGLTIDSGSGDDGTAKYTLGDLFASASGCSIDGCTAEGLIANVRNPAGMSLTLMELEPEEENPADGEIPAATP